MPKSDPPPKRPGPGRPRAEDDPRLIDRNLRILAASIAGRTSAELAREFGLTQRQVNRILSGSRDLLRQRLIDRLRPCHEDRETDEEYDDPWEQS